MSERAIGRAACNATVLRASGMSEGAAAHGHFDAWCVGPDGKLLWEDAIENTVCTVGKNVAEDAFLAGSSYTVTGPFMGLISSVSWSTTAATDTMSSHAGWTEAGSTNAPTFTVGGSGVRATMAFSSASAGSKALSAAIAFLMTSSGTVEGAFVVFGTGASSVFLNTSGTLFSAGAFTGGAKTVGSGDTINVSWSFSM